MEFLISLASLSQIKYFITKVMEGLDIWNITYLKINVNLAKQVSPIEAYLLQLNIFLSREELTLLKPYSIYNMKYVMNCSLLKYATCLPSEVFLRKVY